LQNFKAKSGIEEPRNFWGELKKYQKKID